LQLGFLGHLYKNQGSIVKRKPLSILDVTI